MESQQKEVAREQRRKELAEDLQKLMADPSCSIPSFVETLRVARSLNVEIKDAVGFLSDRLRGGLEQAMDETDEDPKPLQDAIRQAS